MANKQIAERTEYLVAPAADGTVTISTNRGYFIRAVGWLKDSIHSQRIIVVAKVGSTQLKVRFISEYLGDPRKRLYGYNDVSAFLPINNASINQDSQVVEVDDDEIPDATIDLQNLPDGILKVVNGNLETIPVVPTLPVDSSTIPVICSSRDSIGDIMYMTLYDGTYHVAKVDITLAYKMTGVGVLVSKSSATTGQLRTAGLVTGVFSGLTVEGKYYAGFNSKPLLGPPAPTLTNGRVYVQKIGTALAVNVLYLRISPEAVTRIL